MKVYKCDSCGVTIEKPYTEKMKEFCFACEYDEHGIFPKFWKRKVKVHLCEGCYVGLYVIVKQKQEEERSRRTENGCS